MTDEGSFRKDLAFCYKLIAHYGWEQISFGHNSARISDEEYLTHNREVPFNLVTPENLLKVNLSGKVLESSKERAMPAGFGINGAVHRARPDVGCVIHLHSDEAITVSLQKNGLRPLTQASLLVGKVDYVDFHGTSFGEKDRTELSLKIESANILLIRGHGLVVIGTHIAQAFLRTYFLIQACRIQLASQATGEALQPLSQDSIDDTYRNNPLDKAEFCNFHWDSIILSIFGLR
jgi:ribulose-5-phosphate 4-epimerase/fuculose-1-phosphate aldolase